MYIMEEGPHREGRGGAIYVTLQKEENWKLNWARGLREKSQDDVNNPICTMSRF